MSMLNSTFLNNWARTSLFKRCLYLLSIASLFIQAFLIIYTIYDTWYFTCREPLRLYLVVHLICSSISTPFCFYQKFGVENDSTIDYSHHEVNAARSKNRTELIMRRTQSALSWFSLIWFLFGNYLIFYNNGNARVMNWNSCSLTATKIYNLACIIVLHEYVIQVLPLLYNLVLALCLRSTLLILRYMDLIHDEFLKEKLGATPEQMSLLPLFQHTMTNPTRPTLSSRRTSSQANYATMIAMETVKSDSGNVVIETAVSTAATKPKVADGEQKETSAAPSLLYISNAQDRLCPICLSNYEERDLLCQLWCGHHFHQKCVFDWLSLNAICPICKRDCRLLHV